MRGEAFIILKGEGILLFHGNDVENSTDKGVSYKLCTVNEKMDFALESSKGLELAAKLRS